MCDNVNLIEACKIGNYDKVLTLLKRNYSVHVLDSKQATPLYHSCCHGHYRISQALIHYGSDVNARVEWGSTALHAAADRGHLECVKLLIQSGADLSLKNNRGDTALHLCAYRGYIDIVKVFIQSRCDLFIRNNSEKTAFDEAESNNHYNTAALLRHNMIAVQQVLGNESLGLTQDNGISRDIRAVHSSVHTLSSMSIPPLHDKHDNFVRYTTDLTGFKKQSEIPDKTVITQNRPQSQPIPLYNSLFNGPLRVQNIPNSFQRHVSNSVPDIDINMKENRGYFVHIPGREEMENFAESLQMQLVKKIEEVEAKEKKINELQETVSEQADKIKTLTLHCVRLQDENKQVSQWKSSLLARDNTVIQNARGTSHQGIKDALRLLQHRKQINLESCESIDTLKEVLKSRMLTQLPVEPLDIPNKEWKVGKDFTVLGDKPLNLLQDGVGNSLEFLISHKKQEYVLKMVTNLINLQSSKHGDGQSMDQYLFNNFGPEHNIPVLLPPHPNIVRILHHYIGPTDRFRKFTNLLIPKNTDVPLEMATRTTFLVMDNCKETLKSFIEQKRRENPDVDGLDTQFLLQVIYQILSAIYHLQKNGVVHRDINADNIYLDNYLRPIIRDFGFAKTLSKDANKRTLSDSRQECFENVGNTEFRNPDITPEELYEKADVLAVGQILFSLLRPTVDEEVTESRINSSQLKTDGTKYQNGLHFILHNLVLENPIERITERRAMLCAGMMLFYPRDEEIRMESDVMTYYQARILSLLATEKPEPQIPSGQSLTVMESVKVISPVLESDFLFNTSTSEFWEIYQFLKIRHLL